MAGVTPDSTTAAMAANVPKKADQASGAVPGTFPETPGHEPESFSVNPIPASSGAGNPISLAPGEKVPDSSTFNSNTVGSTARTDPAGYEQDASHPLSGASLGGASLGGGSLAGLSGASNPAASTGRRVSKMEPGSGLPVEGESVGITDTGVPIESAAPNSTTAGLASQVPQKSKEQKSVNGGGVGAVNDVPSVVKNSLSEAHRDPEAAASEDAVKEKKEIEDELRQKVGLDESPGTPAPTSAAKTGTTSGAATSGTTTGAATGAATSGATSGATPGTATSGEAPATSGTTSGAAPVASGNGTKSAPLSPRSSSPSEPAAGTDVGGAGTIGPKGEGLTSQGATGAAGQTDSKAAGTSAADNAKSSEPKSDPKNESSTANTAKQANGEQTARKDYADKARQEASDSAKDQKKKNRASGLFQKLKEKLK